MLCLHSVSNWFTKASKTIQEAQWNVIQTTTLRALLGNICSGLGKTIYANEIANKECIAIKSIFIDQNLL